MKPTKNEDVQSGKETNGSQTAESKTPAQKPMLEKFFTDMLKDIYWAEQHLVKELPKMVEAATSTELKESFDDHLYETQRHIKRLEKVFDMIGQKAEAKKCEAMEGLTKEAASIIQETKKGSMTRDAALIIASQKIEHYEIATYGGLVQLAITMGLHKAADILDETLVEEIECDEALTEIAEEYINVEADKEDNYSWKTKKAEAKETELTEA
jgi:ferritin-like metal-binding protein YciE